MTDNPFAAPRDPQSSDSAPQAASAPDSTAPIEDASAPEAPAAPSPTASSPAAPSPTQYDTEKIEVAAAAEPATTQPLPPTAPAPHSGAGAMAQAPDGTFSTAQPAYDASGYNAPPAPAKPAKDKPARVGKGAVAGITVGALLLGLGGGVLGAWGYDEFVGSPEAQIATSTTEAVDRPDGSVAAVAAAVMPSTVSIEAASSQLGTSTGSGFVIREDGYILTNNHVVEGASDITVVFSDGSEQSAELIGATSDYDLAVIKVNLTGLTPLVFADSDDVVVGDDTIAVGSPLGLEATVTTGIVSALHRPVTAGDNTEGYAFIDAIQTDAAINPGNSGGPLLNSQGEVIGVNSAIATLSNSTDTTGSIGLGFAIPSNQAKRTAEELIETGTATYPIIGVQLDRTYSGEGVKVVDADGAVTAGLPADEAGIEAGDVITAIDGRPITQVDELVVAIRAKAPGDEIVLTVLHNNQETDVTVTLASSATLDAQQG